MRSLYLSNTHKQAHFPRPLLPIRQRPYPNFISHLPSLSSPMLKSSFEVGTTTELLDEDTTAWKIKKQSYHIHQHSSRTVVQTGWIMVSSDSRFMFAKYNEQTWVNCWTDADSFKGDCLTSSAILFLSFVNISVHVTISAENSFAYPKTYYLAD